MRNVAVAINEDDVLSARVPHTDVAAGARKSRGVGKQPYGQAGLPSEFHYNFGRPITRVTFGDNNFEAVVWIILSFQFTEQRCDVGLLIAHRQHDREKGKRVFGARSRLEHRLNLIENRAGRLWFTKLEKLIVEAVKFRALTNKRVGGLHPSAA